MSNIYKSVEVLVDNEAYVVGSGLSQSVEGNGESPVYETGAGTTAAYTVDDSVQKKMIIHHARKTADEIIEEAVGRSNEMYREGYLKGLDEGEKQYVGYIEQAMQVLEHAHAEKERMHLDYEKEILALSVSIAEKIIGRQVEEDPSVLHDIFINSTNRAIHENNGGVKVRMSVENISKLMSGDELRHMKAEFISDKSLSNADCIIETENGTADAGIESQLAQVSKSFNLSMENDD